MMSKVPLDNNEVQDLRLGQDEAWEGTKKFCCLFQRVIFWTETGSLMIRGAVPA